MEKEMKFCQSCGMPLTDDVLGTNADGSKNEEYCMYCYKDGKFLHCIGCVCHHTHGYQVSLTSYELLCT